MLFRSLRCCQPGKPFASVGLNFFNQHETKFKRFIMKALMPYFSIIKSTAVVSFVAMALWSGASLAQSAPATSHSSKETKEDIARHRAMSAAHEGAAKCLESGKKEDVCEKELAAACKGLAIGKYCGMKHVH